MKLLLGGNPCTYWSIARKGRETQPSGIGWELFDNYLIARDKFHPEYFLYENNKSMAGLSGSRLPGSWAWSPSPSTPRW